MAFHDVRLPVSIERGAVGGPRFKTSIVGLATGFEKRNIDWSLSRGEWDIGFPVQALKANLDTLVAFYYARQGRAHSFRFKDWLDYTIGVDATDTDQEIGTGDNSETNFQIYKRYISGATTFSREITKPVSGTTRVFLDSVEQMSGWSVNTSTGIVTFSAAPGSSVSVGVICEFDVAVRFANDKLDISMEMLELGGIPNIPIIEVRGE